MGRGTRAVEKREVWKRDYTAITEGSYEREGESTKGRGECSNKEWSQSIHNNQTE